MAWSQCGSWEWLRVRETSGTMSGQSSACKRDLLDHLLGLDSKELINPPVAHKARGIAGIQTIQDSLSQYL